MASQAIWESIAKITPKQIIAGYSELIQRRIDKKGDNAFLTNLHVQIACWLKTINSDQNE